MTKSELVWSTCGHDPQPERWGTRCSLCHASAITLTNDVLLWPAQTDPAEFTAEQIADWFLSNRLHSICQGADGFTFARNNLVRPTVYGYVWVELTLDLDFDMAWMLDVRRHNGVKESRQFLFVGSKAGAPETTVEWHDHTALFGNGESLARGVHAMHWFADTAAAWIAAPR